MRTGTTLIDDDEGTRVIDASGDQIGRVVEVRDGAAYVDPDPGLADTVLAKLGWGDGDEDTYRLESAAIETVTDDEVRVTS
jgi:hypothetical protein